MSDRVSSPNVGSTLAGGIQDVSALLPLIGTEQCEKHVGSALRGGYLYAAAAPLSIFGSLGVVKAGIAILISSISISIPHLSITFHDFKPSVEYLGQKKWFGGKMLKDAGFELTGDVAPLIGMDGHRFKAETRLIEMLEDKHIEDAERITVNWKSQRWNIMLIISTILGAALSLTPYLALLLGPASWRPSAVHLPWIFPALRIVGSCTAAIACQLIIESRVISLMKNRILFMTIHQQLNLETYKAEFDIWLKDPKLQWDPKLPAEQCLWSLKQYISYVGPGRPDDARLSNGASDGRVDESQEIADHTTTQHFAVPLAERTQGDPDHITIPIVILPPTGTKTSSEASSAILQGISGFKISDLHQLQQKHFPSSTCDRIFFVLCWILLGISLPATVVGYIGCFTLVNAAPSPGNGPLVWVGLEAALSILRIFIWASNPSFDEETEVTLELRLSEHQPMVTTEDFNPCLTHFTHEERKPFPLVPEREFLERITPFTGPLDQFQTIDNMNVTLYFTLTTDYGIDSHSGSWGKFNSSTWGGHHHFLSDQQAEVMFLFMTVLNSDMQIGVTLMSHSSKEPFYYLNVDVNYDVISRKFEASVQSYIDGTHPWRIEDDILLNSLQKYYHYVFGAINNRDVKNSTATLLWKWDLSQKFGPGDQSDYIPPNLNRPSFTAANQLYLDRGYEHQLKTDLIAMWSRWIVEDMDNIRSDRRLDCFEVIRDPTSEKAKQELAELDMELSWEWARRELMLLLLSLELEDILRSTMQTCASEIARVREDRQLRMWVGLEFESGWRKRMEQERQAAKKRMQGSMSDAREKADSEGRSWKEDTQYDNEGHWAQSIEFVDKLWWAGINNELEILRDAEDQMQKVIRQDEFRGWTDHDRIGFMKYIKNRNLCQYWRPQLEVEEQMMKGSIEGIRNLPARAANVITLSRQDMNEAYSHPEPDIGYATAKFVRLYRSSSMGKACSAVVYDAVHNTEEMKEVVCDVIAKITTRSVVNVDPEILPFIVPNDHLLFLSCSEGKGEEPAFVQRNRDRWWSQQTTNSSTFYFTPLCVPNGDSCAAKHNPIARILVFLTAPSAIWVRVIHNGENAISVSLREDREEVGIISDIPGPEALRLHEFQPFMLPAGRHELDLVPQVEQLVPSDGSYFLRDIFVDFSRSVNFPPTEPSSPEIGRQQFHITPRPMPPLF